MTAVAEPASPAVADAAPASSLADLRRFRARPDLAACAVGRRWHVEDPITSRYFELGADEYFVLRRLDGRCDWATLAEKFDRRLGATGGVERLAEIVGSLTAQGLVVADSPQLGPQLLARGRHAARRERARRLGNPLAIRLPGFDPEPLLRLLDPLARLFALPAVLRLAAAFVVVTALVVLLRFDELFARIDVRSLAATPRDALRLIVAVAFVKTLHELGHALASRRLGGTCREVGLYLLCGAPCLYCDVTSMWRVPRRWKRVTVGAAGMAVELVIAAAAFWLWRASEPGSFHSACLHVAVVASVGTLLVNGNPLLRYDGYFILSDALGLANLRERADGAFYRALARRVLRLSSLVRRDDEPRWLPLYAAAAWCYRTAIVVGLLWLAHGMLAPLGLVPLAGAATIYAGLALVVLPLVRLIRRLYFDAAAFPGALGSLVVCGVAFVSLAGLLAAWPFPFSIPAPAVVQSAEVRVVYAAGSGKLVDAAAPGAVVRAGEPVARLANPDLEREVVRLRADAARRRLELAHLARRRIDAPEAADGLATLETALATVEERLALGERDLQRLTATAPADGVVAPLTTVAPRKSPAPGDVTTAADSPLEISERGRFVAAGTPLCVVGDAERRALTVLVDESEIGLVTVGARADIRTQAGETATGTVTEVSPVPLDEVPVELLAGGRVPIRTAEALGDQSTGGKAGSVARPLRPVYQVRVALEGRPAWPAGTTADVRIEGPPRSLASRAARWAVSTFHFRLGARP